MGKEWLYWVRGGGGVGRRPSGRKFRMPKEMKDAATSAGCMCAIFRLFNLHHFHSHLNQEKSATGLEAPRNSLEFNEPLIAINTSPMMSSSMKDEELGKIQIKTNCPEISSPSTPRASTCANSPAGTKTPGLVARLMGLDLLPERASPSTPNDSRIKSRLSQNGARSLPETPRVSSARRSDVECHSHRLSLQINKENNVNGEFENTSPVSAKHFVKQVKDRVNRGRAFGLDMTNNCSNYRNREQKHMRRDENLIPVKPTKKKYDLLSGFEGEVTKTRLSDNNNKNSENHQRRRVIIPLQKRKHDQLKDSKKVGGGEKCNSSRFKNKKDPSPPPTKLPLKQSQVSSVLLSKRSTQLSSKPSHSYKLLQANIFTAPDSSNGCAAALTGGATAEYRSYILKILKFAGFISKPNTSSHSIDPSIFHTLELFHTNTTAAISGRRNTFLSHRCNRKLIFHLVDELLSEISIPHFNSMPWISPTGDRGGDSPLVGELCKRIDSFPAANCVVLEDVDALIGGDLRGSQFNGFFGEEENVVCEIEDEIMELLLSETAAMMIGRAAEWRKQLVDATWLDVMVVS
ncbi:hypothetical protein CASFOL_008376 [Castilleja foliolosa]|uniref:DUF3741 domain-containing protein n=1 Tax=Castilleja foliolosa TaxID=1961234 RepID=A0ABD3DYT6_9LAMI